MNRALIETAPGGPSAGAAGAPTAPPGGSGVLEHGRAMLEAFMADPANPDNQAALAAIAQGIQAVMQQAGGGQSAVPPQGAPQGAMQGPPPQPGMM